MIPGVEASVRGRTAERTAIAAAVNTIDRGAAALILEGEAGIGKTTLWAEGVSLARTRLCWVLACRTAEAETKLGFASLADLIEPVVDEALSNLPDPQRRALESTILRRDSGGGALDPRAIGAAALGVVRSLAAVAPVLLAVDDLQWLDRPSARVLAFVLRRLEDEPVLFLATQRRGTSAPFVPEDLLLGERVTRLEVAPLADAEVWRIVATTVGDDLPVPSTQKRIVAAASGNPMVALELTRALVAGAALPTPGQPLPLSDRLGVLVRDRLAALPGDTRRVLSEAAALGHPTVEIVTGTSSAKRRALAKAAEAGVVDLQAGHVRFAHPLFASALYGQLSPGQRVALHRRLADRVVDPEERARHLCVAEHAPDEASAAAIADGAELAAKRGAPDEAADLLRRAAALTPSDRGPEQTQRKLRAAQLALTASDPVSARALLEPMIGELQPGPERASALHLLANAVAVGEDLRAPRRLLEQALSEAGDDVLLRATLERRLSFLFIFSGDVRRASRHARTAVALNEQLDPAELGISLALAAHVDSLLGYGFRREDFERAFRLYEVDAGGPEHHPALLAAGPMITADQLDEARVMLEGIRSTLEDWGIETRLPVVLGYLAVVEIETGDYARAYALAEEAATRARVGHQPGALALALAFQARAAAYLGDVAKAIRIADESRRLAERAGSNATGGGDLVPPWVRGFVALSRGDPARACDEFAGMYERLAAQAIGEASLFRFLADEIEALVSVGRFQRARELLDWWEHRARAQSRTSALALCARCRALLDAADLDFPQALARLEHALEHHDRLPTPFERARTLLVKGEVERRGNRRRAARATLEEALAIFERLGTPLWASKTRDEHARIGGRRPGRTNELTPTEDQVARLVAQGRTNREVAGALFMSVKTVEANLSRIYRKLDVRSRTELSARLRSAPRPARVEDRKA